MEQFIFSVGALYLIALLGMLTHFFKKQIKGETFLEIRDYFSSHLKSTVSAFIITSVAFFSYYYTLATGSTADIATSFMMGYMFDSMLNKWESR